MKTVLVTLALATGFAGARQAWFPCCSEEACVSQPAVESVREADATTLVGRYVEARSASVFAGACHYSSEYTTQGRRAVCGVAIDGGRFAGVDLAGVEFVAAIAAEGNLAEGGPRSSVLFLPAELPAETQVALVSLCRSELSGVFGSIERIERAAVEVDIAGERYALRAGKSVQMSGVLEPDRACCSMPQNVWYQPLFASADSIVGLTETFQFAVDGLGARFERADENNAFVGRWQWPAFAPAEPRS